MDYIPPRDVPGVYAALDILALPSYREGFPRSPLEAAAMQVPVVATRVEGCVDSVQDGITGMLVPVRDANALAEAIRQYLSDPELRAKHGRAGRERVLMAFQPRNIWEATYREYSRLLAERGLSLENHGAKRIHHK
jgi:glycosyltransferase involved in cell wall biosynthesis